MEYLLVIIIGYLVYSLYFKWISKPTTEEAKKKESDYNKFIQGEIWQAAYQSRNERTKDILDKIWKEVHKLEGPEYDNAHKVVSYLTDHGVFK